MSMKRILGTMLASRMGGRGRRRGALGSASALGMLGSRRRRGSGLGGKLGLAALGYMAYQAYQSSQSSSSSSQSQTGHSSAATSGSTSSSSGSIVDKIRDAANEFLGGGSQSSQGSPAGSTSASASSETDQEDLREGEQAAERFSEDEALLMIRAMITAAYADGSLSDTERTRILDAIGDADATAEERATMEREIANPRPLDELLPKVTDKETSEEFYLVSRAAIDGDSEGDRRYLAELRRRLDLTEDEAAEADSIAA